MKYTNFCMSIINQAEDCVCVGQCHSVSNIKNLQKLKNQKMWKLYQSLSFDWKLWRSIK